MMNVTIMFTWNSVMDPPGTRTCGSLIQALRTLRRVLFALAMPCSMASSKPVVEVTRISETLATDLTSS